MGSSRFHLAILAYAEKPAIGAFALTKDLGSTFSCKILFIGAIVGPK
jgi:hypothetical protein